MKILLCSIIGTVQKGLKYGHMMVNYWKSQTTKIVVAQSL
jgi:hypothetical protein